MFEEFLQIIKSTEYTKNAIEIAIIYDDNTIYEEDYRHNLNIALNDLFLFEIDMMVERISGD